MSAEERRSGSEVEVETMLRERYRDDPASAAIACEAARSAAGDGEDLDDLALAWHLARNAERDAAAALSGAIAAAGGTLSEAEIVIRTRLNRYTVQQLLAPPA